MTFQPNTGQAKAAKDFSDFLFSDEKEYILTGPPGVGKTALMQYYINVVIPAYQDTCKITGIPSDFDEVALTATTNKAAEELEKATGWPAITIHSYLGLKLRTDFKTGKQIITRSNAWKVRERVILFADEASMTDRTLYQMVHEGMHKCKIVWIGDKNQLNPVGEKTSPVFKSGARMSELTEPMRTKDPHLQALNKQLEDTVETGVFKPIQVVPGVIDWVDDAGMQAAIAHYFAQQTLDHRILCYTNQRVIAYNDHIRGVRGLPKEVTVGECLVSASFITLNGVKVSIEKEYEVLSVGRKEQYLGVQDTPLDIQYVDVRATDGTIIKDFKIAADVQHFIELQKWLGSQKDFQTMYHIKETYGELRPRDAATAYKAQGSTYDVVFVDVSDISTCHNADQVARMLYVACSRPRTRIIFYGDLAAKYGGLVPA